jgi:hypothetical protein
MNTHISSRPWVLASLVIAPLVPLYAADNDPISRVRLEEPKENPNRFSVSGTAVWNVKADFSRFNPGSNRGPGPAAGGVDHFYDDGYNRVDHTGNSGGYTSFWGYKNPSQLDTANDRLLMHSTRQTGGEIKDIDDDPHLGFQLTWDRELGREKDGKWSWGFEAAFGFTLLDIEDSRPARSGTRTITDAYNLNGVRPPWVGGANDPQYPEHAGQFDPNGPATIIEDTPTRTKTANANGAQITGSRDFDGNWYYAHVGPYIDFPLTKKLSAVVSAGLAVGVIDGHLHFNERIVVPTAGTSKRERGNVDEANAVVGGFLNATLKYALNEKWSIFGGAQYQGMTEYEASGKGRKITLDLTATPFVVGGVSYSF